MSTPPAGRMLAARACGRDVATVAAIAREVPVMLAGGLTAANVADALRDDPGHGRGRGVRRGASARGPGERPTKDPFRVALFVKRAKAARDDRPERRLRADAGPRRPARRRCAPGGGGWSAISVAATCPRR